MEMECQNKNVMLMKYGCCSVIGFQKDIVFFVYSWEGSLYKDKECL